MEKYIELARGTMKKLTDAGADAAQCIVSSNDIEEIQAEGNTFNLMRSLCVKKLTLTAIRGKKMSEMTVNRFDADSIDAAVKGCIGALDFAADDEYASFTGAEGNAQFRRGVFEPDMPRLTARLVEMAQDISREYPGVVYDITGLFKHGRSVYMNSNGVLFTDETGCYNVSAGYMATDGSETTSFGPSCYMLIADPDVRLIDAAGNRDEIERATNLLHPRQLGRRKFTGTLIATPGYTNNFFYDVAQTALSDMPVASKTGKWCNKLGLPVADDKLTLGFLPFSNEIRMGERVTDEGYAAADCTPIEKGVLKSFMLTRHGAAKSGYPRRANGMSGMCVAPGDTALENIIANTKQGILMGRYSGTTPDVSGELSGVAKNSFYIEDGKILYPLVETMMSGNMFDMLTNVSAVSREARRNGTSVLPYVAFEGVTIK